VASPGRFAGKSQELERIVGASAIGRPAALVLEGELAGDRAQVGAELAAAAIARDAGTAVLVGHEQGDSKSLHDLGVILERDTEARQDRAERGHELGFDLGQRQRVTGGTGRGQHQIGCAGGGARAGHQRFDPLGKKFPRAVDRAQVWLGSEAYREPALDGIGVGVGGHRERSCVVDSVVQGARLATSNHILAAGCPGPEALAALAAGVALGADREQLGRHLDACSNCRRLVSALLRQHDGAGDAATTIAGAAIGRYTLREKVGAGAMGEVWAALDPELGRTVALKLLHLRPGQLSGAEGEARLRREAQAMARLSHPNVVAIHELGTSGGRLFCAMELVAGGTLRTWREGRSWREVVRALGDAGRGLAAVHRAGLVHRDFKPDNVLIAKDGRVLVSDFGLSQLIGDPDEPGKADDAATSTATPIGAGPGGTIDALTRTGAVVGTPAYMAPEQLDGGEVDDASDQFSFCVTLYETVFGERPFPARTLAELAERLHGAPVKAPHRARDGGRIPRRLRMVVERGLRRAPAERFPSMAALVAELDAACSARRGRLVLATIAIAGTSAAVAAGLVGSAGPPRDDCLDGIALIDTVWTEPARSHALAAGGATTRLLDDWTAAWRLARRSACSAEPAPRAARLACLDGRLGELRAQLGVWDRGDRDILARAAAAAAALPTPESCKARRSEPALMSRIVVERISQINALFRAGRSAEAQPQLASLIATATAIDDPSTLSSALRAAGNVERDLGSYDLATEHFAWSVRQASRAGDDAQMIDAMTMQAAIATDRGHPLEALGVLDAADAIAGHPSTARVHSAADGAEDKLGLDPILRVTLLLARGDALTQAGRISEAVPELRRAVAILEPIAEHQYSARVRLAAALGVLGSAEGLSFHHDVARDLLLRCLAIEDADYGPTHPELARTLHDLATNEVHLRSFTEALAHYQRARKIAVGAYGENHHLVALTDYSIGNLELQRNNVVAARSFYDHALAELHASASPDHPDGAVFESAIGGLERATDHCREAVPHLERALAILARTGSGGSNVATILTNLGACLTELKRDSEARPILERALAEFARAAATEAGRSETNALLAEIEWRAGHRDRAISIAKAVIAATAGMPEPYATMHGYMVDELATWQRR